MKGPMEIAIRVAVFARKPDHIYSSEKTYVGQT